MTSTPIAGRIAGAPISWGVCEAPDWGLELTPDRVLAEMQTLGLATTELGPTGYLGGTPDDVRANLARYDLQLVGGFLPVPLHIDPDLDLTEAIEAIDTLVSAGSEVVVLAARSADGSYDRKVSLDDDEWTVLLGNLARLQTIARDRGLTPTLHPHVGTAIEDRASVLRLLESSDVLLCLDTGHLLIGGMHPAELLADYAHRVAHVHLKDVDAKVAGTVSEGDTSYIEAVRAGLYTPLGKGDLDIAACVRALAAVDYSGWYVLEQDCALFDEPAPGTGPIDDVRASIDFLVSVG